MLIIQGERVFNTKQHIPDIYHIAASHPDPTASKAILEIWYIAHACIKAINALPNIPDELNITNLGEQL